MIGTGGAIAIVAGIAIFAGVAYLITKQVSNNGIFGDLTGLAGGLL